MNQLLSFLLVLVTGAFVVTGCGQTGELYRADQKPTQTPPIGADLPAAENSQDPNDF